jgi:hypothetical protein
MRPADLRDRYDVAFTWHGDPAGIGASLFSDM